MAEGEGYDAGTAFLQVFPSFKGVVQAIGKEAQKWGVAAGQSFSDSFNKIVKGETGKEPLGPDRSTATKSGSDSGGAFADGFRKRVQAALKTLPDIKIGADSSEADVKLAAIRAELEDLSNRTIGVDIDEGVALAQIDRLKADLDRLATESPSIQVKTDTAAATAQLDKIRVEADRVAAESPTIGVDVDSGAAEAGLAAVKAESDAVGRSSPTITPNVDPGPALAGIAVIQTALLGLGAGAVLAPLAAGLVSMLGPLAAVGAGFGGVAAVAAPAAARIGEAVKAQADATKAAAKTTTQSADDQKQAAQQIADAETSLANARRTADQQSVQSAEAVTNARQGVADAERQADQQSIASAEAVKNARQSLADTEQQAALAVQQADRNVTQVRQQATQDQAAALSQVQQAEQSLASAERTEQAAQVSLTQARKDAVQELQDLGNQLSDAQLSLQQDQINLAKAQQAQAAANAPHSKATALDRRQAALDVKQAQQALKEQQLSVQRLAAQKKTADKAGVKGSQQVVQAQQQLADAQKNVADQQTAVGKAAKDYQQTQVDSAQKIADAEQAAARQRVQSQEDIGKAQQSLADAQRQADQQRVQSAEQVQKAQQGLSDAIRQQGYQQANSAATIAAAEKNLARARDDSNKKASQATNAADALRAALKKLTPQERDVYNKFLDLRSAFSGWAKDLEPAVLPIFSKGMDLLKGALGPLTPIVANAAGAISDLEDDAASAFQRPFWKNFAKAMSNEVGPAIKTGGDAFGKFLTGLAGIAQALTPAGNVVLSGLSDLAGDFSTMGQNAAKTGLPGFTQTMKNLKQPVEDAAKGVGDLVVHLVKDLLPWAKPILGFIKGAVDRLIPFVDRFGDLGTFFDNHPAMLKNLAGGFLGIVGALKLFKLTPLGRVITLFGLVAGGMSGNKDFQKSMKDIGESFSNLFDAVKPLGKPLGEVLKVFSEATAHAIGDVATGLLPIVKFLASHPTLSAVLFGIAAGLAAINIALDVGPLGIAIEAIALLIIGIVELVQHFQAVYQFVKKWAPLFALAFAPVLILPALIWSQFSRIKGFVIAAFNGSKNWILGPGKDLITGLWNGVRGIWKSVSGWFTTRKKAIQGFFNNIINWLNVPGRDLVSGLWYGAKDLWKSVNGWLGTRKRAIQGFFKNAGQWLYGAGKGIGNGLKDGILWVLNKLGDVFKKPLNWIISNIINPFLGLLRAALPGVDKHNLPNLNLLGQKQPTQKKSGGGGGGAVPHYTLQASGGILPGYTPGRDVHSFYSPTGGMLGLSGGEAVMRPEWTRAVGPQMVNFWNSLSRTGGVNAVRAAMGGGAHFWRGGIVGVATPAAKSVAHTAADFAKSMAGKAAGYVIDHAASFVGAGLNKIPGGHFFTSIAKGVIDLAVKGVKSIFGSGAGGGTGDMSAHSASAGAAQNYARSLLGQFGWDGAQMAPLIQLWNGESGWNNLAQNPTSTAFGIPQFLDSTWGGKKYPKTTNYKQQVYDGFQYISGSYGTPAAALSAWLGRSPHWYAKGGLFNPHQGTYDTGGSLPPGFTMAYNGTGRHEQVLTGSQLLALADQRAQAQLLNLTVYLGNREITDIARVEVKRHVGAQTRALPNRKTTIR